MNENSIEYRVFKEVNKRKENLNSLAKRLQDDYNGFKPFEQDEQDRLDLCAILDVLDGIILD